MLAKIALGNVRKSLRDFSVFFLTLVFGVCTFYAFGSITVQAAVLDLNEVQLESVKTVMKIMSVVHTFVVIVLGFLVAYANNFLIRRRKREFGIYLTLGMGRGQVARIMVMETLAVGVAALAVGLALGVLLSQVMMYVTAHLFKVTVTGFAFVFSPEVALQVVGCFAVIFLLSLALNVRTVSHYKLIDLINADKVGEKVTVRSLPVSVGLFLVSLALMGSAYHVLLKNGIMSEQFGLATGLVTVGTALFFYSVSGFLLRFVQTRPGIYLRGLNAFVLRQFNSRVNTAWVSITIVCAMLFLAICGMCTGLSVSSGLNNALERGCPYDASLRAFPVFGYLYTPGEKVVPMEAAAADDYDMGRALRRLIPDWDSLVSKEAQVNLYTLREEDGGLAASWAVESTSYDGSGLLRDAMSGSTTLFSYTKLSQYNALRALQGEEPVTLGEHECLIWNDVASLDGFWQAFVDQHPQVDTLGTTLHPVGLASEVSMDGTGSTISGGFIVNDEDIPADAVPTTTLMNVQYAGPRAECDQRFWDATEAALGVADGRGYDSWPAAIVETAQNIADSSVGLTVVVSYIAIYIGFILLIACASVLALQQLSEASGNVGRYRVLAELGAEPAMVRHSLAAQVGVYFVFPMVVAMCHAACALTTVNDVVLLITGFDIREALIATVAFVVALYGGYYLVTYETSKGMILRPAMR